MDIEGYSLWKPRLKTVELLGNNVKGYKKWREHYPLNKSITYEITEQIPESLITIKMIETSNMPEKTWVFKLESFEDSTILLIKRYTIIKNKLDRFINHYIDEKYSETDYLALALNKYMQQLLEDQEDIDNISIQ